MEERGKERLEREEKWNRKEGMKRRKENGKTRVNTT